MEKAFKITPVLFFFITLTALSFAQVQSRNYLKEDAKADIKSRILLVGLLKEDTKFVEKLQKEGKLADINRYRNQIETYNQEIRKVAPAYWKLNADIMFKYSDEIKALIAADGKKYAILIYTELEDVTPDVFADGAIAIPSLLYHRGDKPFLKPDAKIPIPSSYARDNDTYEEPDLLFALMLLQSEVESIKEGVTSSYRAYMKAEAEKNCSMLKGKTLLLDDAFAAKDFDPEKIKEFCPLTVSNVRVADINDAIYNLEVEGKAVLITMPLNFTKPSPTAPATAALNRAGIAYGKIVVDLKTYKVLGIIWPSLTGNFDSAFHNKDFKKLCECQK